MLYIICCSFGYQYVNIDDCWAASRDKNNMIVPDSKTFPDFPGLVDYVHSKGLLFGLYSDAGNFTCAKRPGSLGYEKEDAMQYAKWKVDYLKYDNCNNEGIKPEARYPVMRDALNATGRRIFYSMCEWGQADPATWASDVGNSWRTTGDIQDNWASMVSRADQNNMWAGFARPGGWNDPDMLEVGNGGMSTAEYTSHFSMWALMKSPLLVGCDIRNMSDITMSILTNVDVIAVNQDTLGVQGKKVFVNGTSEVWAGPLQATPPVKQAFAVILFNRGVSAVEITAKWSDIGVVSSGVSCDVRDLWAGTDMGKTSDYIVSMVQTHAVVMYKLTC